MTAADSTPPVEPPEGRDPVAEDPAAQPPEPDLPGAGQPLEPLSHSRRIDARWASDDTEAATIADELRRLETTRTPDGSSVAPARALTFIVLVDPDHDDEVRGQLKALGTQRASRTIVIRRFPDRTTLGGRAAVIQDDAIGNGLRETIVLDVGPEDEMDLDGILDPLVITDVPSVAWVPQGDPRLLMLLRQIVQTVIIDGDAAASVREALDDSRALREVGMRTIDMAWLRSAPWRVRLASLAQMPAFREQLRDLETVEIETRPDSRVCGALLAGWLGHRLGWQSGPPLLDASRRRVVAQLRDVDQPLPGLAGLTLTYRDGGSRRLSRGPGGLKITDVSPEGETVERTVLGASRGGSGLLPSAMRQVLLPDELDEEVLTATASLDRARVLKQVVAE
ncbi:MAG: glucose-6-phosphate dehydrogenase assembly protein OpcA [Solirubrobacteraceae bacterium]|nr:glucose-6-phosphate dehydrogenase assembly protein OpcA [Solirubrobacteraceae bacterium]